jgi:hypothetical protein
MPSAPPIEATPAPPDAWSSWRAASAPTSEHTPPRVWATLVFGMLAVAAAVFSTFAPWAHYADGYQRKGVDHADGWFVIVLAFVVAGLCGAAAVGLRHLAARLALAASGLAMFAVYLVNRLSVTRAHDLVTGEPLVVGGGLYVVAFAALGVVIAALAMPSTGWPRRAGAHTNTTT